MSKNVNKNINGGAAGKAKAAGRMATVAAATIAMTGGSLLSPLTAERCRRYCEAGCGAVSVDERGCC